MSNWACLKFCFNLVHVYRQKTFFSFRLAYRGAVLCPNRLHSSWKRGTSGTVFLSQQNNVHGKWAGTTRCNYFGFEKTKPWYQTIGTNCTNLDQVLYRVATFNPNSIWKNKLMKGSSWCSVKRNLLSWCPVPARCPATECTSPSVHPIASSIIQETHWIVNLMPGDRLIHRPIARHTRRHIWILNWIKTMQKGFLIYIRAIIHDIT